MGHGGMHSANQAAVAALSENFWVRKLLKAPLEFHSPHCPFVNLGPAQPQALAMLN